MVAIVKVLKVSVSTDSHNVNDTYNDSNTQMVVISSNIYILMIL